MPTTTGALSGNVAVAAQRYLLDNGYPIRAFGTASPTLALLFGLPAEDMAPDVKKRLRFKNAKEPKGKELEMNHSGATIGTRPLTRPTSWNETPDTDPNVLIHNKFQYNRRIQTLDYPGIDLDQTKDGYFELAKANEDPANEGLANEMSTALFATGAGALGTGSQLASLEHLVSNGLTADGESAYAQFGERDRSEAQNAPLRAQVVTTFGTMTKTAFRGLIARAKRNRARPKILIANDLQVVAWFDVFGEKDNVETKYDPIFMEMGSQYAVYDGVIVVGDQFCPSGTAYLLDPDSFDPYWWGMGRDHKTLPSDAMRATLFNVDNREDLFRAKRIFYYGLYCRNPRLNVKIKGITG